MAEDNYTEEKVIIPLQEELERLRIVNIKLIQEITTLNTIAIIHEEEIEASVIKEKYETLYVNARIIKNSREALEIITKTKFKKRN